MPELVVADLVVARGCTQKVASASVQVTPGELVVLLGPNGAGKTLLLRAGLGLVPHQGGSAELDGMDTARMSPVERARRLAYLPQRRPLAWPNLVRDIVALGRFAYGASPGRLSGADAAAVDQALRDCDVHDLADRQADTLSGGELARVHCARAFAAQTPLMVADEPVAALDPRQQFRIMDLFRTFVQRGGGALVVLHDVGLAARYADRLVWMHEGRIVADGRVEDTLKPDLLRQIYGVRATVDGRSVHIDGVA